MKAGIDTMIEALRVGLSLLLFVLLTKLLTDLKHMIDRLTRDVLDLAGDTCRIEMQIDRGVMDIGRILIAQETQRMRERKPRFHSRIRTR